MIKLIKWISHKMGYKIAMIKIGGEIPGVIIGGDKENKQKYEIKQFPKMYHPTDDSVSIPLFVDGAKIVIEIKTV
jgi:ribosomal protein L25 (general stress protein Ctc)